MPSFIFVSVSKVFWLIVLKFCFLFFEYETLKILTSLRLPPGKTVSRNSWFLSFEKKSFQMGSKLWLSRGCETLKKIYNKVFLYHTVFSQYFPPLGINNIVFTSKYISSIKFQCNLSIWGYIHIYDKQKQFIVGKSVDLGCQ